MATDYGAGTWSDELFDWVGHFSPAFVAPNPAMTVTPIILEPVRLTPHFVAPEPEMTVTPIFSVPETISTSFELPVPTLTVHRTFAGENYLYLPMVAPEPRLDVIFGENGTAYDTADFIVEEIEMTVTPIFSTPWSAPALDFEAPEPEMGVGSIVYLQIVDLGLAEFSAPNPVMTIHADINMPLMEDLFNPSELEVILDVLLSFEVPYDTPPGGLYEADGTEILPPNPNWVPEV